MRKLFIPLMLLAFSSQSQDTIKVSKEDIAQMFSKNKGGKFKNNSLTATSDEVFSKNAGPKKGKDPARTTITAKLSKFHNGLLVLHDTGTVYGRVIDPVENRVYTLRPTSKGYVFVKGPNEPVMENEILAKDYPKEYYKQVEEPESAPPAYIHTNTYADDLAKVQAGWPVAWIDFDGAYVNNTSWNYSGAITSAATSLSTANQERMLFIVREQYAPYNVVVTTDSAIYFASKPDRRAWCIVTPSNEWFGTTAGGVAFTGSSAWGDNTPCWVFDDLQAQNDVVKVAGHELGHQFFLYHGFGTPSSSYGVGTGEISWGAIMNTYYLRNIGTWHAAGDVDDIYRMSFYFIQNWNFPLITYDDGGNEWYNARTIRKGTTVLNGLLESHLRGDFFRVRLFDLATSLTVTVNPFSYVTTANQDGILDAKITIYDGEMNQVATTTNTTGLDATTTQSLPPGIFFIKIHNEGNSAKANAYGFVGRYKLTINY